MLNIIAKKNKRDQIIKYISNLKGDKEKASHVYKDTRFIKPEDIAETIYWVATRPKNININRIEIMAGDQAFNPFKIVKKD